MEGQISMIQPTSLRDFYDKLWSSLNTSMRTYTKVINIGPWSLRTTNTKSIPHGLTSQEFDGISSISYSLFDDEIYHIGASLKDLGKKWFGFSKMHKESFEIIGRIN
jgi:hypothetical protein